MRACVQRVSQAQVTVAGQMCGAISRGLLVLLGVAQGDGEEDARQLADKIVGLRIFDDDAGKMNLSLADVGGAMLIVSQFTLLGDCRKGRRPSFTAAAPPELAEAASTKRSWRRSAAAASRWRRVAFERRWRCTWSMTAR